MSPKRTLLLMRVVVYGFLVVLAGAVLAVRGGAFTADSGAKASPPVQMPAAPLSGLTEEGLRAHVEARNGRIRLIRIEWERTCSSQPDPQTWWVEFREGDGTRFDRRGGRITARRTVEEARGGWRLQLRAWVDAEVRGGQAIGSAHMVQTWSRGGRVSDRCTTRTVDWAAPLA